MSVLNISVESGE